MPRALLALIPLSFLGLFFVYPLVAIFRLSLAPAALTGGETWRTLTTDAYYLRVLWFTTWQAAVSTLGAFALGLPAAYVFARYRFPGKTLLRAVTTLPFVLPTVVVGTAFTALLGPRGVLNTTLMGLFDLETPPIRLLHTVWIVLLAHVFYNTSVVIRMVGGFWSQLDPRLGAAAAVLGADAWQRFRHVSLPLLTPVLTAAGLLVYLFNFTSFGVILILGGPRMATLEVEIYRTAVRFFNLPVAAVLALVQIAFTLAITAVYTRLQARLTVPLSFRPAQAGERQPRTGPERLFVFGILTLLGLFLVTPLVALVWRSLTTPTGLGLEHYRNLFINRTGSVFFVTPIEALRNSLLVAAATVALALVVGISAAYLLVEERRTPSAWSRPGRRRQWHLLLDPLFMLPLGTSAVTLGLGYIVALDKPPLNLRASLVIVPIAHALIAFPFVVRSLLPILRGLDPHLREAATVLGADPWRVRRFVDLPILSRGLVVGTIFAFTVSMGEFGASLLLTRPQFPTLPVAIYRFLGQPGMANYGQALALSVFLLAATACAFLAIERVRYGGGVEF